MAGRDDKTPFDQQPADGVWLPLDSGFVAAPSPAENPAQPAEPLYAPPAKPRRHVLRTLFRLALGAVVLVTIVSSLWAFKAVNAQATVPEIVGLSTPAASNALTAAQLTGGNAYYLVTRQFPAGLIVTQTPVAETKAAVGSAVDVSVAIAPTDTAVPDVGQAELPAAEQTLTANLLKTSLLYAYNNDIEPDRVIEQLPRAGDSAVTGGTVVLVVSLGPGVGKSVPKLIGMTAADASVEASSATLFAEDRSVIAPGVANGTVVDQVPSAGSLVPATSHLMLSVARSQ